jgi:hypothetical protein
MYLDKPEQLIIRNRGNMILYMLRLSQTKHLCFDLVLDSTMPRFQIWLMFLWEPTELTR